MPIPKISDLVDLASPMVMSAPRPVVDDAVRQAYFELCRESRVWKASVYPSRTIKDDPALYLIVDQDGGSRVHDVLTLEIDGHNLDPGDFHRAKLMGLPDKGRPKLFDLQPDGGIVLYPTPDKEYDVTGQVILVPRRMSDYVNDFIFEEYSFGLKHGAVYLLASMHEKPWANPNQAQESVMHFRTAIDRAIDWANKTHQKKKRSMSYGGL